MSPGIVWQRQVPPALLTIQLFFARQIHFYRMMADSFLSGDLMYKDSAPCQVLNSSYMVLNGQKAKNGKGSF